MADVFVVASKEFSDVVRSKRFIVIIVIFGLVTTVAMSNHLCSSSLNNAGF